MKQYQISYRDDESLQSWLEKIREEEFQTVLFHIFAKAEHPTGMLHLRTKILEQIPDAEVVGAQTGGNIFRGELSTDSTILVCTMFEEKDSHVKVCGFNMDEENEEQTAAALLEAVRGMPDVKAVEILLAGSEMSLAVFCRKMSEARKGILIFGGSTAGSDPTSLSAPVMSGFGGCTQNLVAVLYSGPSLRIITTVVSGWKPLGRTLHITKADTHGRINELSDFPAAKIYSHYLHIAPGPDFVRQSTGFPLLYTGSDGDQVTRAPIGSEPDGSLLMSSALEEGASVRITFGDPDAILEDVSRKGRRLERFQPEALLFFSCAGRRDFWGDDQVSRETLPFESLAPGAGFYTFGEFFRKGTRLHQYNVSLVITAFREGPSPDPDCGNARVCRRFVMEEPEASGQMSVVARLATFVEVASEEMERTNRVMAQRSITDGLTGLLNRAEIQRRITDIAAMLRKEKDQGFPLKRRTDAFSLIMLDIDHFKQVNDTRGHHEGDLVLRTLSHLMKGMSEIFCPDASVGRWGGEEFMIMLPGRRCRESADLAEDIRRRFHDIRFWNAEHLSVSIGVTEIRPGETGGDAAQRVDRLLYDAKESGRNRVVQG